MGHGFHSNLSLPDATPMFKQDDAIHGCLENSLLASAIETQKARYLAVQSGDGRLEADTNGSVESVE